TLRRFLDRIDLGSSYVLETCFLTHRMGGRVIQVPVSCEDWRASKFTLLHGAFYNYRHFLGPCLRSGRAAAAGARRREPRPPPRHPAPPFALLAGRATLGDGIDERLPRSPPAGPHRPAPRPLAGVA